MKKTGKGTLEAANDSTHMVRTVSNNLVDESYMVIPHNQSMASFAEELNVSNGPSNRSLVRQNAIRSPQIDRAEKEEGMQGSESPGPNVQRMIEALTERMNSMEKSFSSKK